MLLWAWSTKRTHCRYFDSAICPSLEHCSTTIAAPPSPSQSSSAMLHAFAVPQGVCVFKFFKLFYSCSRCNAAVVMHATCSQLLLLLLLPHTLCNSICNYFVSLLRAAFACHSRFARSVQQRVTLNLPYHFSGMQHIPATHTHTLPELPLYW